jgi:hypothetical protein
MFVVPMPPNLTNGRMHHMVKHRAKKKYWRWLDERQRYGINPAPPVTPWSRVRIASQMVLGKSMDDDNALARHKWILDWLVTRGYLVDDKKKNIVWECLPIQTVSRTRIPEITLTLIPLSQEQATV